MKFNNILCCLKRIRLTFNQKKYLLKFTVDKNYNRLNPTATILLD